MFGVLKAIEGYDAFTDLMANTNIGPWYNRMTIKVNNKAGIKEIKRIRSFLGKD